MTNGEKDDSQDRLIGVFEMLIERLTRLESKVDRVESILEHENLRHSGPLNSRAWDLNMNVYVHKPLMFDEYDYFSPPTMYYIRTSIDMDHLFSCETYSIVQKKLVAGVYDAKVAQKDMTVIKNNARLMLDGHDENEWTTCEQVSIESPRRYVYDHFVDVMISDCVMKNRAQWKSVISMSEYSLNFWMEPSSEARENCDVRKCMDALVEILQVMGVHPGPKRVQICPLGAYEGNFFREFDMTREAFYESDGPREEQLRRQLVGMRRTYKKLQKSIENHDFWKEGLAWHVFVVENSHGG